MPNTSFPQKHMTTGTRAKALTIAVFSRQSDRSSPFSGRPPTRSVAKPERVLNEVDGVGVGVGDAEQGWGVG